MVVGRLFSFWELRECTPANKSSTPATDEIPKVKKTRYFAVTPRRTQDTTISSIDIIG